MKTNNTQDFKVGERVYHTERGYFGTVKEIEYNDADEVEVEWDGTKMFLGKEIKIKDICASRTSAIYLKRI